MRGAWLGVLVVGGALASCVVTAVDPGCACSVEFPCRAGEQCVDGVCLLPNGTTACGMSPDAGRTDGGVAGGSGGGSAGGVAGGAVGGGAAGGMAGGSAGGWSCPDAGDSMRWSQCRDGFATVQTGVASGGTVTVGAGNRLDITQTANSTPAFAGGSGIEVPGRGFLPSGAATQGSVRGTLRFDRLPTGTVTFAAVRVPYDGGFQNMLDAFVWYDPLTPGKIPVRLFCLDEQLLSTTLIDGGSADEIDTGAGLMLIDAGLDYDVTLRWELNQLCGLYVNGVPVVLKRPAGNTRPLPAAPDLTLLQVGNVDYDENGVNGPFQMTVTDWRYSNSVMGLQ